MSCYFFCEMIKCNKKGLLLVQYESLCVCNTHCGVFLLVEKEPLLEPAACLSGDCLLAYF